MAVALRLMRTGKKGNPQYRIISVDKKRKRNGAYLDSIGFYDPHTHPHTLTLNKDKFDSWLKKGAVLSEGLRKLLKNRK